MHTDTVRGVTGAVTESEAGVCLALLVQGKCGHLDATQKSSGNGKDLLHLHVSTRWVGRNHTHLRRYYTCAVTQIGM